MSIAGSLAGSLGQRLGKSLSGLGSGGGGLPAPTLTFLQGATSGADSTSYTFSAQSLGEAADDRLIVVCVHGRSASVMAPSTCTVAGVTATKLVESTVGSTSSSCSGIFIAAVPTGATGDIVVTFSAISVRTAVQVYRLTGYSATPASTSAAAIEETISVPAQGAVISATNATSAGTASWTGLTEDYEAAVETLTSSSASGYFADANAALTINGVWSAGGSINRCTAIFEAAA